MQSCICITASEKNKRQVLPITSSSCCRPFSFLLVLTRELFKRAHHFPSCLSKLILRVSSCIHKVVLENHLRNEELKLWWLLQIEEPGHLVQAGLLRAAARDPEVGQRAGGQGGTRPDSRGRSGWGRGGWHKDIFSCYNLILIMVLFTFWRKFPEICRSKWTRLAAEREKREEERWPPLQFLLVRYSGRPSPLTRWIPGNW